MDPSCVVDSMEAASAMLAVMQGLATCLQHMRQTIASIHRPHVRLGDYDEIEFKCKFHFRSKHITELLGKLNLLDGSGHPKLLHLRASILLHCSKLLKP